MRETYHCRTGRSECPDPQEVAALAGPASHSLASSGVHGVPGRFVGLCWVDTWADGAICHPEILLDRGTVNQHPRSEEANRFTAGSKQAQGERSGCHLRTFPRPTY